MIRSIVLAIITLVLVVAIGTIEVVFIRNSYEKLKDDLMKIDMLTEAEAVTDEDFRPILEYWAKLKERSELFINHNDTTEFNMRVEECKAYIHGKDYQGAKTQLSVLIFLADYIPESISPHFENIL
ncbi:MAG: DUF4363 family protein [Clostridia bacterium]|nr:DUF4363 family protein [Clostridia bacterium]